MSDLLHLSVRESRSAELRGTLERIPLLSRLRKELASNRPTWLPLVLVLAAIAVVAYADHLVVSLSLVYLYTLPLTVGAIFLRKEISYGLIVACILFHYFFHYFDFPRHIHLGLRIFHDLSALLCLTLVVYVIQRYIERQESLVKAVQQQRDDLLKDVELAAQVQRLFLPSGKPAIAGLEIAGMMHPARGVGGDYYDYFPIDAHTSQIIIADVSGTVRNLAACGNRHTQTGNPICELRPQSRTFVSTKRRHAYAPEFVLSTYRIISRRNV